MNLEGPGGAEGVSPRKCRGYGCRRAAGGRCGHGGGSWAPVCEFYRSLEAQGGAGMARLQAVPGPMWLEPNRKH